MTLMTLTLMTAFHVSSATFNVYFPVLLCFCNKVLIENDRKIFDESESESLGIAACILMFFTSLPMRPKLRHDVAMATSRRSARHVAT